MRSSQLDKDFNLSWPLPDSAQLSEAEAANRRGERNDYYPSRRPGRYPNSGKHGYDWPDCLGSCYAGSCGLDQHEPGCCYWQEQSGDADGYAASTAEITGGTAVGSYRKHGDKELVC
jgi:hypothetical protein